MSWWLIVWRGDLPPAGNSPSINSGSPGFWSGNGEGIVIEERGLSFAGIAEEQKNWNDGELLTMIDSIQETTGKSIGISGRESESVTGPSREVSQQDQGSSGAENAVQEENTELAWAKLHVKEEPEPRLVERKTELHFVDPVPAGKRKSAVREQQDRTREQLLTRLNELEYRVKNLEHERDQRTPSRTPAPHEEIA